MSPGPPMTGESRKSVAAPHEALLGGGPRPYISCHLKGNCKEIRMFACDAVDLGYVDTAPTRLNFTARIGRPKGEVFAALAHDPANWGEFFPGFDRTGRYETPAPYGVGSRRVARFTGIKFEETILAWEEGARWSFRVDSV